MNKEINASQITQVSDHLFEGVSEIIDNARTIVANIDKKMGKILKPVLEY